MELLADLADALGEPGLDVHVHVLERDGPGDPSALDVFLDLLEPTHDRGALRVAQYPHVAQHPGMSDGALDVIAVKTPVETYRGRKTLHEGVGGLGESPPPRPIVLTARLFGLHKSPRRSATPV